MSKLDYILEHLDHFKSADNPDGNPFMPGNISQDVAKQQIKNLIISLAEAHAIDDYNINLASFIGEVERL